VSGVPAHASPSQEQLASIQAAARIPSIATPAGGVLDSQGNLSSGSTTIPRHATEGVTFGNNKNAVVIGLPDANSVVNGKTNNGTMTYYSKQNADDVVIPTNDGAQFLKVLNGPSAAESFSYRINVPAGGKLVQVSGGPDGVNHTNLAAVVLNGDGAMVGSISLPWAYDKKGQPVQTFFTAQGETLTQHVLHRNAAYTYPIVADPYFKWYDLGVVITFSYDEMQQIAVGGVTAATSLVGVSIPTGVGVIPASVISGALMTVTAGASWGVATHNCFWFWFPYPGVWDLPEHGYYKC